MTFDGWKKVYKTSNPEGEVNVPKLEEGQNLSPDKLIKEQKFTQPPARYTEASLVKEMEEKNIGRPSTYASIISVLVNRKYIKRVKKALEPTKLGFDVIGILQVYFAEIVDVKFTGEMEDNLDSVELGSFLKTLDDSLNMAQADSVKARVSRNKVVRKKTVEEIDEDSESARIVKKVTETSGHFNTISANVSESNMIKPTRLIACSSRFCAVRPAISEACSSIRFLASDGVITSLQILAKVFMLKGKL
mgnify:CR=1 FL=1